MKKILAFLMAALLCAGVFASCGKEETTNTDTTTVGETTQADSDLAYVQEKGKLTIGMTLFAPMDYYDGDTLTGFEVDFGNAVCEKLGVEADFQEISWEAKETELNAKNIDCIWNGLTITDDRKATMSISDPYMSNKQVLCVKKENAEKYAVKGALDSLTVVAEKESAGEEVIGTDDFFKNVNYTAVDSMAKAMMEVASGTADACVIDYVTSIGSIGEGTDYAALSMIDSLEFAPEEYGIAFRQGSDITAKVNEIVEEMMTDGTLTKIAEKYKLEEQLLKLN